MYCLCIVCVLFVYYAHKFLTILTYPHTEQPLILLDFLELASVSSFLNGNSYSYSSANHRVVAHADQTHHLNVCGYRGRTCELRIGVHTAKCICEAIRSRAWEKDLWRLCRKMKH